MEERNGAKYVFKNRKLLIFGFLLGGVLAGGLSFLQPKKYLSTAVIYPYNSHTKNDIIGNPQFGYEIETEQLMQLLESQTMRKRTIDHFQLQDYYNVDTSQLVWYSELELKYIRDVNFFRSKYLSVVINVTTKDPELSADIANFQVSEVNSYRESIFEENRISELKNTEFNFNASRNRLMNLKDSIYKTKKGGRQLIFNFIQNLDNENYDPSGFVDSPELENLVEEYMAENRTYVAHKAKLSQLKELMRQPLPSVYSIDRAVPSYKKASPSILKNALIGAFTLLILTLTISLISEKYRQLKVAEK